MKNRLPSGISRWMKGLIAEDQRSMKAVSVSVLGAHITTTFYSSMHLDDDLLARNHSLCSTVYNAFKPHAHQNYTRTHSLSIVCDTQYKLKNFEYHEPTFNTLI